LLLLVAQGHTLATFLLDRSTYTHSVEKTRVKGDKQETKVVQQCKNANKRLTALLIKRLSSQSSLLQQPDAEG